MGPVTGTVGLDYTFSSEHGDVVGPVGNWGRRSRLHFSRERGDLVGPVSGAVGLDYTFSRERGNVVGLVTRAVLDLSRGRGNVFQFPWGL